VLILNAKSILGALATVGVAVGVTATDEGLHEETGGSLERACAGLTTDRQLEHALAAARAFSNGGDDQICSSIQVRLLTAAPQRQDLREPPIQTVRHESE
jgi:hypothetical protein